MEIVDKLDNKRQFLRKTSDRSEKIVGEFRQSAHTWIMNSEGKFLMQKRSPEKDGLWGTTGGHPKSGEDSLTGMHTEILEELGLDIDPNELNLVTTVQDSKLICDIYYLKKDINLDDIVMQESEVADVKYFTLDEIEDSYQKGEFKKSHYYMFKDFLKNLNK